MTQIVIEMKWESTSEGAKRLRYRYEDRGDGGHESEHQSDVSICPNFSWGEASFQVRTVFLGVAEIGFCGASLHPRGGGWPGVREIRTGLAEAFRKAEFYFESTISLKNICIDL